VSIAVVVRGADSGSNIATAFLTAVANVACATVEVVGGRGSGTHALGGTTAGTHTIFGLAGIGSMGTCRAGCHYRVRFGMCDA
jgi:hypothetical protein